MVLSNATELLNIFKWQQSVAILPIENKSWLKFKPNSIWNDMKWWRERGKKDPVWWKDFRSARTFQFKDSLLFLAHPRARSVCFVLAIVWSRLFSDIQISYKFTPQDKQPGISHHHTMAAQRKCNNTEAWCEQVSALSTRYNALLLSFTVRLSRTASRPHATTLLYFTS